MYTATKATYRVAGLDKRIRAVCGGTSAGKTIAILQVIIQMMQTDRSPKVTSIVSESLPHLKLGAMRDFLQILKEHGYYVDSAWNRTNYTYTEPTTGSIVEFFGADSPAKAHGPRRHRAFFNELNNIPRESFDQMEVRTSDIVFADWNPTNEFYFYTEILPTRSEDVDFITLTYRDNEALPASVVKSIEARQGNRNWWRVYGLGELGEAEGRIYTGWQIVDDLPHEARLEGYGLDFGYTNDPTAIIAVHYLNGGYVLDERAYQKGLSNKAIADVFQNLGKAVIIADSAEPKSIDELSSYGLMVLPADKGPGSVRRGIDKLQSLRISVTSRSVNLLKEYRNYMWETDRDGRSTNEPMDAYNHALDAVRYRLEKVGMSYSDEEIVLPEFEPVFSRTGY